MSDPEWTIGRELEAKGLITVGPCSHVLAVKPDLGVGHGTVEVNEDPLSLVGLGNREMLAVPADAFPRQLAGVARKLFAERAFDRPVVRYVELPPGRVIEAGR